jgi:VanZ family protein
MEDPTPSGARVAHAFPIPAGEPPVPWSIALRYWSAVVLWMGVISYMSTDAFSAHNTNTYIDPILRYLFPGITNPEIVFAHSIIRKAAHFGEFLVLSVLAFWALRSGRARPWALKWALGALLLAGAFAIVDELHQAFTTSRTPSPGDSAVDFFGAAAGQALVYARTVLGGGRPGSR